MCWCAACILCLSLGSIAASAALQSMRMQLALQKALLSVILAAIYQEDQYKVSLRAQDCPQGSKHHDHPPIPPMLQPCCLWPSFDGIIHDQTIADVHTTICMELAYASERRTGMSTHAFCPCGPLPNDALSPQDQINSDAKALGLLKS